MSQKIKTTLFQALPAIVIATLLVVAIIYAWTEPNQAPPGGNVAAPINVGSVTQYKSGALGIGGLFWAFSDAIFNGKVGIGTASPGAKLDIAGTIKIADGTQGAGKVLTSSDATGLASWQSPSGIPSGAVMSFNLSSCPAGWTELTQARGRYIVGLTSGGALPGSPGTACTDGTNCRGTALTNLENRPVGQHTHAIPLTQDLTTPWGYGPLQTQGGEIRFGPPDPPYTIDIINTYNAGAVAGTNAPYIQLLVCQKI